MWSWRGRFDDVIDSDVQGAGPLRAEVDAASDREDGCRHRGADDAVGPAWRWNSSRRPQ